MSVPKPSPSRTAVFIVLVMGATAVTSPLFCYPADNSLSQNPKLVHGQNSTGIIIPIGTQLPLMYETAEKILITQAETMPLTLKVAANIMNHNGTILIPYGSEIMGQIEPAGKGCRFVAEKLIIKQGNSQVGEYPLKGISRVVTRIEIIEPRSEIGDIGHGTIISPGAASVIAEITGNSAVTKGAPGAIATEGTVGDAGLVALAGWLLDSNYNQVISIDPNRDFDLTLNVDLRLL